MSEPDDALQRALRSMLKRDAATKLKALKELADIALGRDGGGDRTDGGGARARGAEELAAILPRWTRAFRRLRLDDAHAVRVAAARATRILAEGAGKGLAKHLKPLMPAWWAAAHDPSAEVRAEAMGAFDAVFKTPEKRANALRFAADEIVAATRDELVTFRRPSDMPYRDGTEEELRERHERMVCASVAAVGGFARTAMGGSGEGEDLDGAVRLLPIRPRSRGARRSLRTFPVVTLHPRFPFNV